MKKTTLYLLILTSYIYAEELIYSETGFNNRSNDRAMGYLHQGLVKTSLTNYGNFFDWHNFPSGLWGSYSYIPHINIMVGIPGKDESGNIYPWALRMHPESDTLVYWGPTVSESWFDRTSGSVRTDWESVEGASGQSFSGNVNIGEIYGGLWNIESNDSTPLLATSTLESTWPVNDESIPFWPGWLNEDGSYFSDQDIYLEFDDRFATRDIDSTQGYPTNIRIKLIASSYSDINLQDAVIYRARVMNGSIYDYENLYIGFYFDADIASTDSLGSFWVHTNDDDLMGLDENTDMVYNYDVDGISNGAIDLAHVGVMILETESNIGLTGFRGFDWYNRPGVYERESGSTGYAGDGFHPVAEDKEAIQYALLSNNINYPNEPISNWEWRGVATGLNPRENEYNNWFFHPDLNGVIDPNFDSIEGLADAFPNGFDYILFISSGPYNILSSDSLEFSFAVVFGEDELDLLTNAQYLKSTLSSLENINFSPNNIALKQNYPNPFNPTTTIRFNISVETFSATSLQIFDITGRLVETLVNDNLQAGEHEIVWNAGNLSSGVYFVRLESGEFVENQKVMLMK